MEKEQQAGAARIPQHPRTSNRRAYVTLLLLILSVSDATGADMPAERKWIADPSGCKVLDPDPTAAGKVEAAWNGKCVDGYMDGKGKLEVGRLWSFDGDLSRGLLVSGTLNNSWGTYIGTFDEKNKPREGTYELGDGTTVKGLFSGTNNKMEVTRADGWRYEGDVDTKTLRMEGNGVLQDPSGATYRGSFRRGMPEGSGSMSYPDGTVLEGQFVAGTLNGKGKQTQSNGDVLEGNFKNGLADGKGRSVLADGGSYEGDFVAGRMQGHGLFKYSNGESYEGEWLNDLQNGHGRAVYADGIREGEWKAGHLTGKCTMDSPGMVHYEGTCLNGERSGTGHYQDLKNGIVYDGTFTGGNYDGHGRLSRGKYVYDGSFKSGNKEGLGKETFANGSYDGEFQKDQWHGHGKLETTTPTGFTIRYEGTFAESAFAGAGAIEMGGLRLKGDFRGDLRRTYVIADNGRRFTVDMTMGVAVEILPDGTLVVFDEDALKALDENDPKT